MGQHKVDGGVPKCPNHGEPLQLDNMQRTQTKGSSPCPVSGVLFEWTQDAEEQGIETDKFGNSVPTKRWVVEGEEKPRMNT